MFTVYRELLPGMCRVYVMLPGMCDTVPGIQQGGRAHEMRLEAEAITSFCSSCGRLPNVPADIDSGRFQAPFPPAAANRLLLSSLTAAIE